VVSLSLSLSLSLSPISRSLALVACTGRIVEYYESSQLLECTKFFYDMMTIAPDCYLQLTNTQYTLRSNGTSTIFANFLATGTKPITLPSREMINDVPSLLAIFEKEMSILNDPYYSSKTATAVELAVRTEEQQRKVKESEGSGAVMASIRFEFPGQLIFHIDEDCRVTSVDVQVRSSYRVGENVSIHLL
jgi:hypothetical protein